MTDTLEDAVTAARHTRLREKGINPDRPIPDGEVDPLLGDCQQNAAAIRDELRTHGINCQVVGGALQNAYPPGELPDSFETVKLDGFGVHYWVEADDYICELASESEHAYGDPLVTPLNPDKLGYAVFSDSYDVTISF